MSEREDLFKAFEAGYKEREVDVREDNNLTERIIEREFEKWYKLNYCEGE